MRAETSAHLLEIVERVADHVGIIDRRCLVVRGPLAEVAAGRTLEERAPPWSSPAADSAPTLTVPTSHVHSLAEREARHELAHAASRPAVPEVVPLPRAGGEHPPRARRRAGHAVDRRPDALDPPRLRRRRRGRRRLGLASSLLGLIVFAFSILLLAIQIAGGQLSPRIIARIFRGASSRSSSPSSSSRTPTRSPPSRGSATGCRSSPSRSRSSRASRASVSSSTSCSASARRSGPGPS